MHALNLFAVWSFLCSILPFQFYLVCHFVDIYFSFCFYVVLRLSYLVAAFCVFLLSFYFVCHVCVWIIFVNPICFGLCLCHVVFVVFVIMVVFLWFCLFNSLPMSSVCLPLPCLILSEFACGSFVCQFVFTCEFEFVCDCLFVNLCFHASLSLSVVPFTENENKSIASWTNFKLVELISPACLTSLVLLSN